MTAVHKQIHVWILGFSGWFLACVPAAWSGWSVLPYIGRLRLTLYGTGRLAHWEIMLKPVC